MGNLISTEAPLITVQDVITTPTTTIPPAYANSILLNTIIKNQNQVINKLENINSKMKIELNGNIENFTNFSKTDIGLANFKLPPYNIQELNDITNMYNASVDVLNENDSQILDDSKFAQYLRIQDKKIQELQNTIQSFPTASNIINPIKSIKNIQTSQILNVEEFPDPNRPTIPQTTHTSQTTQLNNYNGYKGNGAIRYPNYLIYGNNGCLEYNSNTQSYIFLPCNANNANQRFNINQITTLEQYNSKITKPENNDYRIVNTDNAIMGFHVVNPETDTNSCLTINSDGLSVLPCNMDSTQRFKPQYHTVLP